MRDDPGRSTLAAPDARLGYAYVMNKMDFHLQNDPREKALRDAVDRAIARRIRLLAADQLPVADGGVAH